MASFKDAVRELLTIQEQHRAEQRISGNAIQEEILAREALERRLCELRGEVRIHLMFKFLFAFMKSSSIPVGANANGECGGVGEEGTPGDGEAGTGEGQQEGAWRDAGNAGSVGAQGTIRTGEQWRHGRVEGVEPGVDRQE